MLCCHQVVALGLVGALALSGCTARTAAGAPQAPRTAAPARPNGRSAAIEHEAFELVNRYRSAHGLPPLTLDPRIGRQARLHSADMAAGKTPLGHDGFDERVRALSRVMACQRSAENVAVNQGYRDPASEAVRGWLASRGHRTNIEGRYELTGLGVASNAAGEVYFTQLFVGR